MSHTPQEPTGSTTDADPTDTDPDYSGMPGWVKWFVIAAVALGVVLLVAKLVGGEHGPSRHGSASTTAQTVSASAIER